MSRAHRWKALKPFLALKPSPALAEQPRPLFLLLRLRTQGGRQSKYLEWDISSDAHGLIEGKDMPLGLEFGVNTFRWHF